MKNFLMVVMAISLAVGSISGCGNSNLNKSAVTQNTINDEYSETVMKTINGNDFNTSNSSTFVDQYFGFGLMLPETVNSLIEKGSVAGYVIEPYSIGLGYYTSQSDVFYICGIWRYEKNASGMEENFNMWKELYTDTEVLVETDTDVYYWGYNKDISNINIDETKKAELQSVIDALNDIKNGICIFKPNTISTTSVTEIPAFEAKDFEGNTVTNDIFADYDLTMVNVWATWCGPCIEELPGIGELYKELPEKTNIISICTDANYDIEFAKQILSESGCDFTTIVPSEGLEKDFLMEISSIPYTVFVNSKGEIIGNPQIGAPATGDGVKDAYKNIINERLEIVKGDKSE